MSGKNYLDMSDEELLNAPMPNFEDAADEQQEEGTEETDEQDNLPEPKEGEQGQEDDKGEQEEQEEEDSGSAEEGDDDEAGDSPAEEKSADEGEPEAKEGKEEKDPKAEAKGEKDEAKQDGVVDYKAEYERLMAPFKANGREIQVRSVDDAISLMQMGANYNKKMAALKPNLKILKMLENHQLLDEQKLSFLIDLEKKNPAAINKLVKDSGLDPMDLDADKASGYQQTSYTVDDREIALDTVLDELEGSETYKRTLDVVGNKWDAASKKVVAQIPDLIKVINDHMESGIYDLIAAEVERERLFGRLNGLSDLDAYRQVGDAMNERGQFNHLVQGSSQTQGKSAAAGTVVQPKPKKAEDDKLKERRRAASSTKPAAPKTTTDFNPLSMSDEEFAKIDPNYL